MLLLECEVRNNVLPKDYDFDAALASQTPETGLLPPKTTLAGGLAPSNSRITPQDIWDAIVKMSGG